MRAAHADDDPGHDVRRSSVQQWLALAIGVAVIFAAGVGGVLVTRNSQYTIESARLQAIVELHAEEIRTWLGERTHDAEGAMADSALAALASAPRDAAGAQALDAALESHRRAETYVTAALVAGDDVRAEAGVPLGPLAAELRRAVADAARTGRAVHTDLYRRDGPASPPVIDFVVPLPHAGAGQASVVVLRIDASRSLFPLVATPHFTSATAETLLLRRDGDDLLYLTPLRFAPGRELAERVPLSDPKRIGVRVLHERMREGGLIEGADYRGRPVVAWAQPVAGTPWILLSKMDRDELMAVAVQQATWIVLAGLLAIAAMAFAVLLLRKQRELRLTREINVRQDAQIRATGLLAAIASASTDAIYAKDRDGRYLLFNPAAERITGRRAEDVIGRGEEAVFDGDMAHIVRENDRSAIAHGAVRQFDEALYLPGGTVWVNSTKGPLRDDDGTVRGLFGISRDVTEQRLEEQSRRDRERRLLLAIENYGLGVWDWNLAQRDIYMSPQCTASIGFEPDEHEARAGWIDRIHPDDLPRVRAALQRHLRGHSPGYRVEYRVLARDGSWRTLLESGTVIERDEHGRATRAIGTRADVTAQRTAEQELRMHREHLAELVLRRTEELEDANRELSARAREIGGLYNGAPCGYLSFDAAGLIVRVNDTLLQWLGYARDEVVGRVSIFDMLAPEYRREYENAFERLKEESVLRDIDAECVRRDGRRLQAIVSAVVVLDESGRFREARATVNDNRERRARELEVARLNRELAQRAHDAESANRAKSTFLANMSHEIRTPMNAVIGLTHLMRRSTTDARQVERLDKIGDAAEHLLSVVNDVLDISKIEAGKLVLEDRVIAVREMISALCAWAAERAREKGVTFLSDVAPDVPHALRGDPTRLRQALLNYVSNAVKFTDHGSITLRARLDASDADSVLLRLEVEDTGVGVPLDSQARLFDAFEQGDGSTTRRYGGTGLGLAITRLLSRQMGGAVGMSSAAGAGSTFWFTARLSRCVADAVPAPIDDAADPTLPGEEALRAAWRGTRVLLVEDNPVNREVAEELLAAVGLSVDIAVDGAEAVERARHANYAVILMDVQMPVMDGLDATRAIRRLPGRARTPIVAMTAAASRDDRSEALRAGMDGFVPKPFRPAALYACLRPWLPAVDSPSTCAGVGDVRDDAMRAGRARGDAVTAGAERPERDSLPPPVDALVTRLAAVPGLDVRHGLAYANRDPQRYVRFLTRFVESASHDLDACRTSLERRDVTAAARAAHSLKGSASFVGAVGVRDAAIALEVAIRGDDPSCVEPFAAARRALAVLERAAGEAAEPARDLA